MPLKSLRGRLDGRPIRIAWLGSPGSSEEILPQTLEEARRAGHDLALALTGEDAGAATFPAMHALPCSEAACRTVLPAPWPKEPAWLRAGHDPLAGVPGLRSGGPGDLEAVAEIHATSITHQRLAVERESAVWERMLAGSAGEDPFWVIETYGRVRAYVMLKAGAPTVRWREHGARPGAEALLADLFWTALSWARRRGAQRIEGWFMPEILTVLPLYPTSDRRRRTNVVMLAAFGTDAPPRFSREEECRLWELDVSASA